MLNTKQLLSTLWIFLTVNYLFCDVFSLYYSEFLKQLLTGEIEGILFTEKFLLSFAIIMEIPMIMIVLSKILNRKQNRAINIVCGVLMMVVQIGSLITGNNKLHYIFFSLVEISTLIIIILLAWNWIAIEHLIKTDKTAMQAR